MSFPLIASFEKPAFRIKPASVNPYMHDVRAFLSVALSIVILAYSGVMSTAPILAFYALWLPLIFYKGRFVPTLSRDFFLHVFLGLYCLSSTLWSYYPWLSWHNALEFISMLLCTVIMARLVRPEMFIKGIMLGTTFVLLPALWSNAIFSMFGSKNQVGFVAEIGFLTAFLYLFGNDRRIFRYPFALLTLLISGTALVVSSSATSDATSVAVIGVGCITYWMAKLPRKVRAPAFFAALAILIPLIYVGYLLGAESTLLAQMGKDSTLTGRTYLWSEGFKIGLENPILGRGMSAFWVVGEPRAEKYWYEFYVFNRTGFHFHSLFVQTFVDLGLVGLLAIIGFILTNCFKSLRYVIDHGSDLYATFSLCLAAMFFLRSFAEVDVLGPFGIGPFLFYAIVPMLAAQLRRTALKSAPVTEGNLL